MAKVIKKRWKILRLCISLLFELGILLAFIFAFGIRTSYVQTKMAQGIASYLSKELNAQISIQHVEIDNIHQFLLKEIYVEDKKGDTLLFVKRLQLDLNDFDLEKRVIEIGEIEIENALFTMIKYPGDEQFSYAFLEDYFGSKKSEKSLPYQLNIEGVEITNSSFRLTDFNKNEKALGVDYSHLNLTQIEASIKNFSNRDNLSAQIDQLAFYEHSGFKIEQMQALVAYSNSQVLLQNLDLISNASEINANQLSLSYSDPKQFKNFLERVKLSADFEKSIINTKDLAYFASFFEGIQEPLDFQGKVAGTISDLTVNELKLGFGQSSTITGSLAVKGLPDFNEAYLEAELDGINLTINDIQKLKSIPFKDNNPVDVPSQLSKLQYVNGKASFTGTLQEFNLTSSFTSGVGKLQTNLEVNYDSITKGFNYFGEIESDKFDVGLVAGVQDLGKVSTRLAFNSNTNEPFSFNSFASDFTANFREFEFMGYLYTNIEMRGALTSESFDGTLSVEDENIDLLFDGMVDFGSVLPRYNFTATIRKAHLFDLNIEKSDKSQIICSTIEVDGIGSNADNFNGSIVAKDLSYYLRGKDYFFDSINLVSTLDSGSHALSIYSNFIDLFIDGSFSIQELPAAFYSLAQSILPSIFESKDAILLNKEDFSFFVDVKDLTILTELFVKDLEVAPNTQLNGSYQTGMQDLNLFFNSKWLKYKDYQLINTHMEIDKFSSMYEFTIKSDRLYINDSVYLDDFRLVTGLFADNIDANLSWQNADSSSSGNVDMDGYWMARDQFHLSMEPSIIYVGDELWNINEDAEIIIDSTAILLSNIRAINGDQIIDVNGVISEDPTKRLEYVFSQFELSNLNALLTGNTVLLDGQISANGNLRDFYGHPVFQLEYDINECNLNGKLLGDVWGTVKPYWQNVSSKNMLDQSVAQEKIIGLDIMGNVVKEGNYQFDYLGKYFLDQRSSPLDFVFNLNDMNLDVANGFIPNGVSDIKGRMDGSIRMTGSSDSVLFDGFVELKDAGAHIDLLNTDYTLTGKVSIENDGFYMSGISVKDKFGKTATLWDGSFYHINFKEYSYNFQMGVTEPFLVMNTTKQMSSLYYGDAFITGDVAISYDKYNELEIQVAARSEKGTNVVLPLDGADEVELPNFISFKDRSNPNKIEDNELDLSGIKMNFDMELTPEAQISIVFDEVVGDVMSGNGSGNINMEIDEFEQFGMYGFYEVNEGNYLFTMFDFIKKPFSVRKGGSISWYGDPYNADINLAAAYETKASLYDIMPVNEREQYKTNTEVNCLIKLTDNLFNPDLKFEIELPRSDDNARAVLRNVISSDEELNKQVFSLMVLNKFLPRTNAISSASSSALNAGVGATTSDLLSSQIGNWLNGLSDDIEIGVNAKFGDKVGEDEVAVAMSKAFLNDRLEISGNFGVVKGENADNQESRLVGDVNVEYKLNDNGNLRVRAFNAANKYDFINNTQSSTQGVGIYYKENFENWWELKQKLGNLFRPESSDVLHYKGVGRRRDSDYIEGSPF